MTFQSPFFLFALLVVFAVLLLAYFVTRRNARYPVTFTNLGVLAEIVPARRRAWKHLVAPLLLALALAFAAGALAHPAYASHTALHSSRHSTYARTALSPSRRWRAEVVVVLTRKMQ